LRNSAKRSFRPGWPKSSSLWSAERTLLDEHRRQSRRSAPRVCSHPWAGNGHEGHWPAPASRPGRGPLLYLLSPWPASETMARSRPVKTQPMERDQDADRPTPPLLVAASADLQQVFPAQRARSPAPLLRLWRKRLAVGSPLTRPSIDSSQMRLEGPGRAHKPEDLELSAGTAASEPAGRFERKVGGGWENWCLSEPWRGPLLLS